MWASEPMLALTPALVIDGRIEPRETITLTEAPVFYAMTGFVLDEASQLRILLDPLVSPPEKPVSIYFDDIILAKGNYPLDAVPSFGSTKDSGMWGSRGFVNFARNPSAESGWVIFKPQWLAKIRTHTAIPVYALPALQDFALTSDTYQFTLKNLLESYWAKFGWGHVRLSEGVYLFLRWFTTISALGTLTAAFLGFKKRQTSIGFLFFWFACNMFFIWSAALARQMLPFWDTSSFTPSARYAYPAMIPTILFIMAGWHYLGLQLPKARILAYLPIAILVILDITSLVAIVRFYNSI